MLLGGFYFLWTFRFWVFFSFWLLVCRRFIILHLVRKVRFDFIILSLLCRSIDHLDLLWEIFIFLKFLNFFQMTVQIATCNKTDRAKYNSNPKRCTYTPMNSCIGSKKRIHYLPNFRKYENKPRQVPHPRRCQVSLNHVQNLCPRSFKSPSSDKNREVMFLTLSSKHRS